MAPAAGPGAEPAGAQADAMSLAVLLATELDAGVTAALAHTGGLLVLEHVVARVGHEPTEGPRGWQGEVVLRPRDRSASTAPGPGPGLPGPGLPRVLAERRADLVEGVGPTWADRLDQVGLGTLGRLAQADPVVLLDLAARWRSHRPFTFAARAADCAVDLPEVPEPLAVLTLRTVLAASPTATSERTRAPLSLAVQVWHAATRIAANLDETALELTVDDLRGG